MKFTSKKQYFIFFALLSVIASSLISIIIYRNTYQYKLHLSHNSFTETQRRNIYYDLNGDGISEEIVLLLNQKIHNDYLQISNQNNRFIEQVNLFSHTNAQQIYFEDQNLDGIKEVFAFSELNDSLFLTIYDIKNTAYLLNRQFLIKKPDEVRREIWDFQVLPVALTDSNKSQIIFGISSGYSIYPRGIFIYDFEIKSLVNEFRGGAPFDEIVYSDIDNDGVREIICATNATGNLDERVKYNDKTKWLFVFDQNLSKVFDPIKFSTYPGWSNCLPIKNSDNSTDLLLSYSENEDSGYVTYNRVLNIFGEITKNTLLDGTLKNNSRNFVQNEFIYTVNDFKTLIKINTINGNTFSREIPGEIKDKYLRFIKIIWLNNEQHFLVASNSSIMIVDNNLEPVAITNLSENIPAHQDWTYIKSNGPNKLPQIALLTSKSNVLLNIVENKVFNYLPLIFLASLMLFFLFFILIHNVLLILSTYTKYFHISINKTKLGIAIINNKEKVFYKNKNFNNYLNIEQIKTSSKYLESYFDEKSSIYKLIQKSFESNKILEEDINISSDKNTFEGKITITPFTTWLGFTYAYLIEISDYTEPLLTDRGKVWGATLQRIAHEIKTPLSTLILSLDNIKNRFKGNDDYVNEEIYRMQSELGRLKELTKNFMIFSNLEKQNIAKISLYEVIEQAASKFKSYFENNVELVHNYYDFNILGDFNQLVQLFSLCIENSIDALNREKSGFVKIISEETIGHYIKVIISDNGIGMSAETIQKAFEPYYSTKKDGTGMGLTLVKKIVEDNKGKIEINSELQKGTEIIIYFLKAK